LPVFKDTALEYFEEKFFTYLDENQPLNSPDNQQTSAANDKIRKKKTNLKNNIYQIYNSNIKKLTEEKQKNSGGSPPIPKDELTKSKEQAIERINKVLTDQDNLRN